MILLWVRNAIYAALLVAATPWLLMGRLSTGRRREGWRQKVLGLSPAAISHAEASEQQPLIWLHGVSVGEVQLLRPLIDELRTLLPDARFAVSTTTSTGMELARELFDERVRLFYFPLDFSWAIRRTLSALQPSLIVLGELEIWPNLIDIAERLRVPVAVVNGRLSERSFRSYRRLSWLTRGTFSKLSLVAAQATIYRQRFAECGTPLDRVQLTGSIKFDNVSFDRAAPQVEAFRRLVGLDASQPKPARVWVMGSTQAPEERAAVECFARARQEFPELKLIIVPRHRERFEPVAQELRQVAARGGLPLKVLQRSSIRHAVAAEQWDVLLVDTIGELRWWWGLAEIAVVGGSFGKRGGQNMLEPAAYGINVGFGPNTRNFRDVVELLLAADAAQRIESLEGLPGWLLQQLREPAPGCLRGSQAQRLIARQQGALRRTAISLAQPLAKRWRRLPDPALAVRRHRRATAE